MVVSAETPNWSKSREQVSVINGTSISYPTYRGPRNITEEGQKDSKSQSTSVDMAGPKTMKSHSYDCLHKACTTWSQVTVQHWGGSPTASISSGAAVDVGGFGERELVFSKSMAPQPWVVAHGQHTLDSVDYKLKKHKQTNKQRTWVWRWGMDPEGAGAGVVGDYDQNTM